MFYAVLLSPLQPRQPILTQLRSALSRSESTYERTFSTVNLVDRLLPGVAERLSRWMYRNNRFPWAPVDIELIAFGSGAAVFKLTWPQGVNVLRIYRRSLGRPPAGLLETAAYYKKNYETVLSWYGAVVLPMEFLVLPGLPLIGPVAASLQPYIHGERKDLFDDFSDDELLQMFEADDRLREQFIHFAGQTIRQWDAGDMCYDFLGRENILVARHEDQYQLHIADVGIFKFNGPAENGSSKLVQIEQRIARLSSLYELAKRSAQAYRDQAEFMERKEQRQVL
jgi:hypothetical protein